MKWILLAKKERIILKTGNNIIHHRINIRIDQNNHLQISDIVGIRVSVNGTEVDEGATIQYGDAIKIGRRTYYLEMANTVDYIDLIDEDIQLTIDLTTPNHHNYYPSSSPPPGEC